MMKNLPRTSLRKSPPLLTLAHWRLSFHCVSLRAHTHPKYHTCLRHSSGVLLSSLSYTFPTRHCCISLEEALRIPLWAHCQVLKDLENPPVQPAFKKARANVATKEALCVDKHQVIETMCRPLHAALQKVSLSSCCLPASGNPGQGGKRWESSPKCLRKRYAFCWPYASLPHLLFQHQAFCLFVVCLSVPDPSISYRNFCLGS